MVFLGSIFLGLPNSIVGQDIAQLAVKARDHLYETWNFDSAAYYFDLVIGEKYAPAFAYSDYGWYLMLVDRYTEGMTFIKQAAEMSPADKQLVTWYSWALFQNNELSKAKQWITKALAIDPDYGEALFVGSIIASGMEHHQEATTLAEKAAAKDPSWRTSIPLALARAGEREQALLWAEKIARDENVYDVILLMEVYGHLKDDDQALDYLRKSYELRHPFLPWLKFLPGTRHLHDNPQFKAIVQKMNLPQ